MKKQITGVLALFLSVAFSTYAHADASDEELQTMVVEAIALFKTTDPAITEYFNDAYGYVVFPNIVKGGLGIGGARGRGQVYEQGKKVGYAKMTQFTIGAQVGGQAYSEVIFFENSAALENFKQSKMEFAAQISAIAATAGASKDAAYKQGVVVFTVGQKGLMAEASVGGQKFKYTAD